MAETIKSALFVDHDSIYRSLKSASAEAAERLALRTGAWVAAIESGRLVSPRRAEGAPRRRIALKRCYADLRQLGRNRNAFAASGFELVDCPKADERPRNAADIQVTIDAMDALGGTDGFDEFILLSADADWTPVLRRLGANSKARIVYANGSTTVSHKSLAEAIVDEAPLIVFLSAGEVAVSSAAEATSATRSRRGNGKAVERADIEALARKIHAATNVPLFSPRTFAELFHALTDEIAASGYHFQTTAENVAARLAASGRNVTRRQVVFVVKGLALKGHVFSTTDTPERLAEVFREQVLYLAGNAGLDLSEHERSALRSWIVGATAGPAIEADAEPETTKSAPARSTAEPAPAAPSAEVEAVEPPAKPAPEEPSARTSRRRAVKPAKEEAEAPKPAPAVAKAPEPAAKPAPAPAKAPESAEKAAVASVKPVEPPETPAPFRPSEAIKLAASRIVGARPAVAASPKTPAPQPKTEAPAVRAPAPAKPAPAPQRAAATPPAKPPAADKRKEALESSILAAIAQAVDVLVEDSEGETKGEAAPAPPVAEERPDPEASDGGDSDDIGDEIQRIIASYSRARRGETS